MSATLYISSKKEHIILIPATSSKLFCTLSNVLSKFFLSNFSYILSGDLILVLIDAIGFLIVFAENSLFKTSNFVFTSKIAHS